MAEKKLNVRIQLKRDSKSDWATDSAPNFIPKEGEPVVISDGVAAGVPLIKIGDGDTKISALKTLGCEWNNILGKPKASTTVLGLVKLGYTTNGKNYKVTADADGDLYVNVPWVNTGTNTDTKVTQTITTSNSDYPLLLAPAGQIATATTTSYFATALKYNPSTQNLSTKTFTGALNGNATTATRLQTARNINGVAFDGTKKITIKANPTENQLTNQDLNTIKTSGFYYAGGSNSVTNKPNGIDAFGLLVYKDAGAYCAQELTSSNVSPLKKYIRQWNNITWSDWVEMKYTDTTYTANVTYNELKTLRDNSKLQVGCSYRITDYECTTVQEDTQSAGHQFDLIVIADDVNVLNENARAIPHEGDTYFKDSNLSAWEVKYCLDNDIIRFNWADTTNGKGVIYYLKDEWNNECCYDFKNIQFKRYIRQIYSAAESGMLALNSAWTEDQGWKIVYSANMSETIKKILNQEIYDFYKLNPNFFAPYAIDNANPFDFQFLSSTDTKTYHEFEYKEGTTIHTASLVGNATTNFKWFYTFSSRDGNDTSPDVTIYDGSVRNNDLAEQYTVHNNTIKANTQDETSKLIQLNNIVFFDDYADICFNNLFEPGCYNMSFGYDCYNNTFGNSCHSNTFGFGCDNNIFGNGMNQETFESGISGYVFRGDTAITIDNNKIGLRQTKISGTGDPGDYHSKLELYSDSRIHAVTRDASNNKLTELALGAKFDSRAAYLQSYDTDGKAVKFCLMGDQKVALIRFDADTANDNPNSSSSYHLTHPTYLFQEDAFLVGKKILVLKDIENMDDLINHWYDPYINSEEIEFAEGVTKVDFDASYFNTIKKIVLPSTITSLTLRSADYSQLKTIIVNLTTEKWNKLTKTIPTKDDLVIHCIDNTVTKQYVDTTVTTAISNAITTVLNTPV